jgi:hypothetical protein
MKKCFVCVFVYKEEFDDFTTLLYDQGFWFFFLWSGLQLRYHFPFGPLIGVLWRDVMSGLMS